jgi:arginyl-tRNA synthetase
MEKLVLKNSLNVVRNAISQSLKTVLNVDESAIPVSVQYADARGDYQSAFAMKIYNGHKKRNDAVAALPTVGDLATKISEDLQSRTDIFSNVSVVDGKFVWFTLADSNLINTVNHILTSGVQVEPAEKKLTIAVDFSSPNVAKEMHVGHLRSTIIGDSICRVFEFYGHNVKRINHLGDWGTQFGMLISNLFENYPQWEEQMPDITDLETFYKQAKKRFDAEPEFKDRSRETVVKLQGGDEKCLKAWKAICDTSKTCFEQIYERLWVEIEHFGESYYNNMFPSLLKELDEKKLTKEDKGALCMFIKGKPIPLMIKKSDGGYNYDTTDMAAIRHRIFDLKSDRYLLSH